jgi:hypothetical protein
MKPFPEEAAQKSNGFSLKSQANVDEGQPKRTAFSIYE